MKKLWERKVSSNLSDTKGNYITRKAVSKSKCSFKQLKKNLPASGIVAKPSVWIVLAFVFEVHDIEDGESVIDVSLHGVVSMVPIGRDGEGPVIYQARDHV